MVGVLFKIRLKQGWRYLLELGWWRSVLVLIFAAIGWLYLLKQMVLEPMVALPLFGLTIFYTFLTHLQRQDKPTLEQLHGQPWLLFFAEYAALALPFWAIVALSAYGWLLPVGFLLILGISLIPFSFRPLAVGQAFRLPFLPLTAFEWRSGLRKELPQWLVLMGLGFAFLQLPWVLPLVMVALALLAASFYFECEPLAMLNVQEQTVKGFLWGKFWEASWAYLLTVGLPAIIFVFLQPEYWFLPLYSLLVGVLLIFFAILLKYALYEPQTQLSFNAVFLGLMTVSFLLPFLFPIPFLMMIRYYRRAIQNLTDYMGSSV